VQVAQHERIGTPRTGRIITFLHDDTSIFYGYIEDKDKSGRIVHKDAGPNEQHMKSTIIISE
jgi:hypothetical protein